MFFQGSDEKDLPLNGRSRLLLVARLLLCLLSTAKAALALSLDVLLLAREHHDGESLDVCFTLPGEEPEKREHKDHHKANGRGGAYSHLGGGEMSSVMRRLELTSAEV
ncbi:hypothetical protein F5Y18DRAFT_386513 [Xylariaceae sp. FL1019]|nr:hypothetical protein F5Y18DRAFT_386513 [Xylariaceae sp. FL1019]